MASRLAPKPLASCVLEVERKFRTIAVRELTQHGGTPPFRSLSRLPAKTIQDSYYDRSDVLSAAGAWVRNRDGKWQAKLRLGGDFKNSRFEELDDARDIAACVRRLAGIQGTEADCFGLLPMATFSTRREAWVADSEFLIVLDSMDFGHEVGEVELQQVLGGEPMSEVQKKATMEEMDNRIVAFMKRYSWAFAPGHPTGKLMAYFERMRASVP
ncbi:CYTH-like domain-containing protein [Lasiosphaeria miniovina]|uniref:Thiamine-triphosphatase n=1 Tax=Lasiosphaeria miniovina TaxID=1954250 RepID=A0AA40AWJ6_9PEZI|nr:CYTH-like domain-containing protein [Lasiosphaeria miniovina]KAK0723308.1 CYTH-like domain-containing protein [Lasiosphaeria miniovina]